jgi:hypothetical protein
MIDGRTYAIPTEEAFELRRELARLEERSQELFDLQRNEDTPKKRRKAYNEFEKNADRLHETREKLSGGAPPLPLFTEEEAVIETFGIMEKFWNNRFDDIGGGEIAYRTGKDLISYESVTRHNGALRVMWAIEDARRECATLDALEKRLVSEEDAAQLRMMYAVDRNSNNSAAEYIHLIYFYKEILRELRQVRHRLAVGIYHMRQNPPMAYGL